MMAPGLKWPKSVAAALGSADGNFVIRVNQTVTFRYSILFHTDDATGGKVQMRYEDFQKDEQAK